MSRIKEILRTWASRFSAGIFNVPRDNRLIALRMVGLVAVLLFFAYHTGYWYNTDMLELNKYAHAAGEVNKELKRKENLFQNLTNAVVEYSKHERDIFKHVSEMREEFQALEAAGVKPSPDQSAKIELVFLELTALVESYPELKAEQCYSDLMELTETTEDRIAGGMDEYIESALDFNICNQCFWCNYWTIPIASIAPMPAHLEYYHTDAKVQRRSDRKR